MRFVLALVAFVIAAGLLVAGVAQRTFLLPADRHTTSMSVPSGAHYVVIPGSVLNAHTGLQHVRVSGAPAVFAAYGRSSDVTAWLSGERYVEADVDDAATFAKPRQRTAPVVAGVPGGDRPDPDGSDLWLDQQRASGTLNWTVRVPSNVSLLLASDGSAAAPSSVSLSWPQRVSTPLSTPLIVAGGLLAVVGLLLYIWALVHVRRRRGPRRKSPPRMPRPPQPAKFRPAPVAVVAANRGRRSVRQIVVAGLSLGLGSALLAGGAPVIAAPKPVAVASAAVTESQAERIVGEAAAVAAAADAKLDATVLEKRFTGPALALRRAAYLVKKHDKTALLPQGLPTTGAKFEVTLPEATASWPRTLFAVVADPDAKATTKGKGKGGKAPQALTLVQATPRDPYRVLYQMALEPGAQLPNLPLPAEGGARLRADAGLLTVAPGALSKDYGLLLRKTGADEARLFDTSGDKLLAAVGPAAKKKTAQALGGTAKLTFSDGPPDPSTVVALGTADSGALVSVALEERSWVKPGKSGVKIGTSGGVKILSKVDSTAKGIRSTYGYQLLFAVPPIGSKDRVRLLGYAQGLISAKEL